MAIRRWSCCSAWETLHSERPKGAASPSGVPPAQASVLNQCASLPPERIAVYARGQLFHVVRADAQCAQVRRPPIDGSGHLLQQLQGTRHSEAVFLDLAIEPVLRYIGAR